MIRSLKKFIKLRILKSKIYLNTKYYLSLKKNLNQKIGQVVEEEIKKELKNLIDDNRIQTIVEIGTWNGLGSTKMILDLIKNHSQNISFFSIESNYTCFKVANKNLKSHKDNINLLLGRVHDLDDLEYVTKDEIINYGYGDKEYQWWIQDLKAYRKITNVKNQLPQNIDILFLDGGEFSTYADFKQLYKKSNYIILDDTKTFKQHHVLEFISNHKDNFLEIFSTNQRNGYKIFKHKR